MLNSEAGRLDASHTAGAGVPTDRQSPQFAVGEDESTEEESPGPQNVRYDGAFDEDRNVWDS